MEAVFATLMAVVVVLFGVLALVALRRLLEH
jgi:hypothetical protein